MTSYPSPRLLPGGPILSTLALLLLIVPLLVTLLSARALPATTGEPLASPGQDPPQAGRRSLQTKPFYDSPTGLRAGGLYPVSSPAPAGAAASTASLERLPRAPVADTQPSSVPLSAADTRGLPRDLIGKDELTALRTADSTTFDMGEGTYALVQDTRPMNYRDRQGSWQPIDPAFVAVENGWMNATNAVNIGLSPRRSDAKIGTGEAGVGWEPRSLAATHGDGRAVTLAEAVSESEAALGQLSADRRSVRYTGSWTDPALQDQWRSGFGSAEYTMRLSSLPRLPSQHLPATLGFGNPLSEAHPDSLELRVSLHLRPGTMLHVGGEPVGPVDLPLETGEAVSFVSAAGDALWLQPPQAHEQGDPSVRSAGSYRLTPTADPTTVELAVRVRWNWLAADERRFPVVIDPLFQMRSGTLMRSPGYLENGSFADYYGPGVGLVRDLTHGYDLRLRLLVKFDMPTMPQDTEVDQAYLVAMPTSGGAGSAGNYVTQAVEAYVLTDWDDHFPAAPEYTTGASLGAQLMGYSEGVRRNPDRGAIWDVTAQVADWFSNPSSNHGILLKAASECWEADPNGCGALGFGDAPWLDDELEWIETHSVPTDPATVVTDTANGGVRLMVFYRGPGLGEGDIVGPNTSLANFGLPDGEDPYFHADHEYRLEEVPDDDWQAVIARGLGTVDEYGNCPFPGMGEDCLLLQNLAGTVPLQLRIPVLLDLVALDTAEWSNEHLNYALLNGRQAGGESYYVRVPPVGGENGALDYDIRLIGQNGGITAVADDFVEIAPFFDSNEPMALWNIDFSGLPAGSNVRVDVEIEDVNINKPGLSDLNQYARHFSAQLFEGGSQHYLGLGSPYIDLAGTAQGEGATTCDSVELGSGIFAPDTSPGNYALVLAYNGPGGNLWEGIPIPTAGKTSLRNHVKAPASENGDGGQSALDEEPTPMAYGYRVRVTACSEGTFPTKSGQCQEIRCPTAAFPSDNRREHGGLQLWSEEGWDSPPGPDATSAANFIAPLIGPPGDAAPTVAVVGGQIRYSGDAVQLSPDSQVLLVHCGSLAAPTSPVREEDYFQVYGGEMERSPRAAILRPAGDCRQTNLDPWRAEDQEDLSFEWLHVAPLDGRAMGGATLTRRVDGVEHSFEASYWVGVGGWPSLESSIERTDASTPPTVASLILGLGDMFSLDVTEATCKVCDRNFVHVRNSDATISQPLELGGATKPVQALILGVNIPVPSDPKRYCAGSCIDLRALDDAYPDHENRQWKMPDVHTNVEAGTVMVRTKGKLQVYSTDHPLAPAGPQSVSQEFSFDTFGASVSVGYEPCDPGGPQVAVIRGETQLTMPNIGAVGAGFKLCESSLRSVHFEFYSPVGIPLANTGMFLTGMSGQVDIYAEYTQINFGLNFQTGDGGHLFDGWGDVTIDTRGYFEFQGAGEILGLVDASGRLWVAWSPLDIGIDMGLVFELTDDVGLEGSVWAHMWEGQGWQHKYHWLPDNDEKHMSAQIAALLYIKQGAAFSWWAIDIPPSDIEFGVEVAFGEFCTNASCSSYEWGVKGKFIILGYDIGMYFGFDHGIDFILGNDDHVLIDQYGLAARSLQARDGGDLDRVAVRAASLAVNGVATETLAVSADAEHLLVALGWQAGAPQLTLCDPDGTDVSVSSAYTVAISTTTYSTLMGVQLSEPKPGDWQAVISNLSGIEHYKFIYFANKGGPGTAENRGRFLSPGAGFEDGTGVYTITWEAPPSAPVSATISLHYTPYVEDPDWGLRPEGVADVPIVKHLPFSQGSYVWDTSGLENDCCDHYGVAASPFYYKLRAVVDDGVNDFPPGAVYDPRDPCEPRCELPSERAFDPDRFPGISTFSAAGYIMVNDTVAPEAPKGLELEGVDGAILARWDPSPERDLAAYLVRWGTYRQSPWPHWRRYNEEQITAVLSPTLRLGGLVSGTVYQVAVKAIDANGNASRFSSVASATVTDADMDPVPLAPMSLTAASQTSTDVHFAWSPAATGALPDSYRLVYQWLADFETIGGYKDTFGHVDTSVPSAAVHITDGPAATGLRTGASYRVSVSAMNSDGWTSASSDPITVTVTDGVDSDGDGLPDDWAFAYAVHSATLDADLDGLENALELSQGTDPTAQDSDGDGFSDWEESDAGTDALDRLSFPAQMTQPRLELETHRLVFRAKKGEPDPYAQFVRYRNSGGGILMLAVGADSAWIDPRVEVPPGGWHEGVVLVGVATSELQPGYHAGVVRLEAATGSDLLIGGPHCIGVELWLSPADTDIPPYPLYLPLILSGAGSH